jgi:spermidine/putrescine transport system ATP-binding protein
MPRKFLEQMPTSGTRNRNENSIWPASRLPPIKQSSGQQYRPFGPIYTLFFNPIPCQSGPITANRGPEKCCEVKLGLAQSVSIRSLTTEVVTSGNPTGSAAVDCRDLVKEYGTLKALDGVSLAIRPNEFFTLLGPSGCGKTTLLRSIAGFSSPDRGSISVNGQVLDGLPPHRRPVNTVFQSYAVFPHMSVAKNIAFGLEMQRYPRRKIAARVEEMLALVRLEHLGGRMPAQLSGGQQQRVAFARALAPGPRVLLLDEPLSALDQKLRNDMQLELKRLQRDVGITFIFVTHDQREALTMSDRIAVMSAGRVLQIASPQDIYERPAARFVAEFIGETNLIEGMIAGPGRYRTRSGFEIRSDDCVSAEGTVTLVIRPERTCIVGPSSSSMCGLIEQVVYEGGSTTYYVETSGDGLIRVCEQNREGTSPRFRKGEVVGLSFPSDAIRVLPA